VVSPTQPATLHVLASVTGVPVRSRKERVDGYQCRRFSVFEVGRAVTFEGADQQ